jgi:hypothetical protein
MGLRDTTSTRRERWDRENATPRLKDAVPELVSLRLVMVEMRGDYSVNGTRRVQHVVVATASARFEIPCGESGCNDGGHDLSRTAMSHLRDGRSSFSGTSECNGALNHRPCDRRLDYSFEATYSVRQ